MGRAYFFPVAILVVGAALVAIYHDAPRYSDPDWRENIPHGDSEAFYLAQENHVTIEVRVCDAGKGLLALGASLIAGLFLLRIRTNQDFARLQTPSRRWVLLSVSAVTWLSFIPAEWLWLYYTARRGDYPSWADSIAIPMGGAVFGGAIGLPIILIGMALCLWRAQLPARLWSGPIGFWGWSWTVVLSLLGTIALVVVFTEVLVGNVYSIPITLVALYLLACGRAATAVGWLAT